MSKENTAEVFREEGARFQRQGLIGEAEECFMNALALEGGAKDHETLFRLAELFLEKKDLRLALGHYILAIRADLGNSVYKQRFLDVGGGVPFDHYNSDAEDAILQCLRTPGMDFSNAGVLWVTTLLGNPDFARLYADPRIFEKIVNPAPLLQLYFIEGLKRVSIHEPGFEDFIRRLRQWLLMGLSLNRGFSLNRNMPAPAYYLRLADAVAAYCSFGDYIIRVTAAEKARLRDISGQLSDPLTAAVYACYGSAKKEQDTGSSHPRWHSLPRHTLEARLFFPPRREKMERTFAGNAPKILVAGCATGREALVAALHYPKGEITAIDPGPANLAYAAMKSRDYNVTNITFHQEDFSGLGKYAGAYDIIYANGVLHHLQEPLKNWKILWDCLKPAGLMKIGLYSKAACRSVAAAREVIGQLNISSDRESMLDFRARSAEFLSEVLTPLSYTPDYYSLPAYRDFLFRPGVQYFTLPEIEKALAGLRLSFTGFDLPAEALQQYGRKFPQDAGMVSLRNWHQFELEFPDTFAGMYQFWCRKF